jgi:hypothetical protein
MNRRGFFSRILGREPSEGDRFFFGIQLVINVGTDDALRQKLHRVVNAPVGEETPLQKRAFYKRLAAVLMEAEPFYDYAFWDYRLDPDEAQAEFESWVNEIEGGMATEEEEVGETVDEQFRMAGDKSYVVVSMACLMENATALANFRSMIEGIPAEENFSRPTFTTLVNALHYLDFEYSLGDAVFIMPGSEKDGVSWEELHTEGWDYLRPIA